MCIRDSGCIVWKFDSVEITKVNSVYSIQARFLNTASVEYEDIMNNASNYSE